MSGHCDFCGMWHSSSCYHPARAEYDRMRAEIERLQEEKRELTQNYEQYVNDVKTAEEAEIERLRADRAYWRREHDLVVAMYKEAEGQ